MKKPEIKENTFCEDSICVNFGNRWNRSKIGTAIVSGVGDGYWGGTEWEGAWELAGEMEILIVIGMTTCQEDTVKTVPFDVREIYLKKWPRGAEEGGGAEDEMRMAGCW